jgi:conjugal transfer pilus assembly protein TraV
MRTFTVAFVVFLGGCASTMSGLNGSSQFSCKAPDGVTCSSLSGVYANAVANNLPALRKEGKAADSDREDSHESIVGRAPESGSPIRVQSKVLRVWIAPWEDTDGDLHDQSYVYLVTDPGHWRIKHNQKRIVDRYRPTFVSSETGDAPRKPANPSGPPSSGGVILPGPQMYNQGAAQSSGSGGPE